MRWILLLLLALPLGEALTFNVDPAKVSAGPSAIRAADTAGQPARMPHTVSFTKTDSAPAHVDDGGSRRNACSMRSTAARK